MARGLEANGILRHIPVVVQRDERVVGGEGIENKTLKRDGEDHTKPTGSKAGGRKNNSLESDSGETVYKSVRCLDKVCNVCGRKDNVMTLVV